MRTAFGLDTTPPQACRRSPQWPRRRFLTVALVATDIALLGGCRRREDVLEVDLSRTLPVDDREAGPDLHFAVGTMISPRETPQSYGPLSAWLGRRLGQRVVVLQRRSYAETNDLLLRGEADVAFICTGAYAAVRARGVQILAVPVVGGTPTYRSLIIVHRDDAARAFEDLRGSKFAFVDLLSLTGRLYPEMLASRASGDGGKFFGPTIFTHSHSDSISVVADRRVRAAGVDSLVFDALRRTEPDKVARVRVLAVSEPFGIPPFVSRPGLAESVRNAVRSALLSLHEAPDGAKVLASLSFERLEAADDAAYDTACEIMDRFGGTGGGR